jgi:serine phosphatase RsbU (regulator of sigma subunit)
MIYGVLDTRTRDFRYVAAGHPRPVRVRAGEAPHFLESGGTGGTAPKSEIRGAEGAA